ncbi:hypothetical protein AYJ08_00520 [Brevibacillus sp. SKDU10]|uniref:hypothetical protein n=1 Tax=Brevibacillus sp. SKDU10 TaxID=1247872 RepID=UPI0007C885E6|nr:hypothetical protein [Brevibacillus sp. SKDU10]OAJ74634.1 hypothetical protein AYJ08_00520 [Brevibacillus sp. SKDU10]
MKKSVLLASLVTVLATSFGITSVDASSKQSTIDIFATCKEETVFYKPGIYIPHVIKSGSVYLEMKSITNHPDGSSTVLYVQKSGCNK